MYTDILLTSIEWWGKISTFGWWWYMVAIWWEKIKKGKLWKVAWHWARLTDVKSEINFVVIRGCVFDLARFSLVYIYLYVIGFFFLLFCCVCINNTRSSTAPLICAGGKQRPRWNSHHRPRGSHDHIQSVSRRSDALIIVFSLYSISRLNIFWLWNFFFFLIIITI